MAARRASDDASGSGPHEHVIEIAGPQEFDDADPLATAIAPGSNVIGRIAVRSLIDELITYPKPGLVSLVDCGSHDDMDAGAFVRGAFALRHYFRQAAAIGRSAASFQSLRGAGVAAERRMLDATDGVNTHRGAIFVIGLLAAAAGRRGGEGIGLGEMVRRTWSDDLRRHRRPTTSHGSAVLVEHGVGGALAEAAAGFPHLYDVVLPAYRGAVATGSSVNAARVQAFFASVATLDDTNLLHRGGRRGLDFARRSARDFVDGGGVRSDDWREQATVIHRAFVARRLSPGGSADLLAACCFVHALDG